MPEMIRKNVLNWASIIDYKTLDQAERTARLPFLAGPLALMPDAHFGLGSTVGSVIPTQGAIIPAAVGVDIGCGMIAAKTNLNAADLPDDLGAVLTDIEAAIPAGVGKGHKHYKAGGEWLKKNYPRAELSNKDEKKVCEQFGTLGSGNHFVEVSLDQNEGVWIVLHSGSRGIGNKIARQHIEKAKGLMKQYFIKLEDQDLAYFTQGTPEFKDYIADLLWAQDYALSNRERMMDIAIRVLHKAVHGEDLHLVKDFIEEKINCHHNYSAMEHHHGKNIWVTRKGAIKAAKGDLGVIPGSMGTDSYIVRGLGNPSSYNSSSHGAGRVMSRSEAKRVHTADDLAKMMGGRTWLADRAQSLVDEIPSAYKPIEQVMEDQKDLSEVVYTLNQVLNYKGT